MLTRWSLLVSVLLVAGCAGHSSVATTEPPKGSDADSISALRPQYPSTYRRHPNPPVLIRNGTAISCSMSGIFPERSGGAG